MRSIISLSEGQYHSPSGEYNGGAHPYGVRLPGRCIFYSRLFPDRLRRDRRNFISRPPLGRGAEHFDILPALQPPGQRQLRADRQLRRLLRRAAPEDAGQIVRTAIGPVHREHHVADLPPERCAAIDRRAADGPEQLGAVVVRRAAERHRLGQHGDHEPPPLRLAVVIGADLPRHTQRIPACRGRLLQKLQRREHRQRVRRAGQALDLERESIKPAAVVFMGIARSTGEISGQDDLIDDMFHSPTSLYSYGRVYSPAGAIMICGQPALRRAVRERVEKAFSTRSQTRPVSLGSRLKRLRLAASHEGHACGASFARLRAERYFLRRTRRRRK